VIFGMGYGNGRAKVDRSRRGNYFFAENIMSKEKTLDKALKAKIRELRVHFGLHDQLLSPVISAWLQSVAENDLQAQRYRVLCAKAGLGNPEHSYLFSERDRSERRYRLSFQQLERLLRRQGHKKQSDNFGIAARFGYYRIKDGKLVSFQSGDGEEVIHWKAVLAFPDTYGFHSKPPQIARKIGNEYFISPSLAKKYKAQWNFQIDPDDDGVIDSGKPERLHEKAEEARRDSNYEPLKPSQFDSGLPKVEPASFGDELPIPANKAAIKSVRNRLDYLTRKARKTGAEIMSNKNRESRRTVS
jgi:hypothetical protein